MAGIIGDGTSGFNLVESDLTPGTASDDIEPTFSPSGDFIAFVSNRLNDGTGNVGANYHLWLMNRDGSNPRQITGLSARDQNTNQRRPSWSPDGNQLAYIDGEGESSQLYITDVFADSDSNAGNGIQPPIRQRTFRLGEKRTPAWAPNGLAITFATNTNPMTGSATQVGDALGSFDLYSINPAGTDISLVRLTGLDALSTQTDELNPAYSLVNQSVIFFSTNRAAHSTSIDDRNGDKKLNTGRRIWKVNSNGQGLYPVTDPTRRGSQNSANAEVVDDYPASSLGTDGEQLAFQSNAFIDSSDATAGGAADDNIWSFSIDSTQLFNAGLTAVELDPIVYVSNRFGSNVVALKTDTDPVVQSSQFPPVPVSGPEGVLLNSGYVYVAARGEDRIERYDASTGDPVPGSSFGDSFTPNNSVPSPTDIVTDGTYIYVASVTENTGADPAPVNQKTAIYRFRVQNGLNKGGEPAPLDPVTPIDTQYPAAFSTDSDGQKSAQGIAIGPNNTLYVSDFNLDRIDIYNKSTGKFIRTFVQGGLDNPKVINGPTDITFVPDQDGDGSSDLAVSSENTNNVVIFSGPRPRFELPELPGGDVIRTFGDSSSGLSVPRGLAYKANDTDANGVTFDALYVASTQNDTILRYDIQTGQAKPRTIGGSNAVYFQSNSLDSPRFFAFNDAALGINTPNPVVPSTELTFAKARVLTSIISSPNNFAASDLDKSTPQNVKQDKAADVHPTYSRAIATPQLRSRLIFASRRVFAPNPTSNTVGATPSNTSGDDGNGTAATHDIWTTATFDRTPPILIPQGAGNVLSPVVSPGPDSPFFAPRTFESGLRPNDDNAATNNDIVRLAVVLRELESGISSDIGTPFVTATFYQAGREQFSPQTTDVNADVAVRVAIEQKGSPVPGRVNMRLNVYDNGSPLVGGNELQADAVAGDGLYYCEGLLPAPRATGDFYIDVNVRDRAFNTFTYDNIYGFSTQEFVKADPLNDLFVSDYTAGQNFPALLTTGNGSTDPRFFNMPPVESYYLNNPGGIILSRPASGDSEPVTLSRVDVWRTLSRGSIPSQILSAYRPSLVAQIDPSDPTREFTQRTRPVPISNNCVIWGAPYARTTFAGPGSITDPDVQLTLTNYLEGGGRLLLSGREILFGLTSIGTTNNNFARNELFANFGGETRVNNLVTSGTFQDNLEIPFNDNRAFGHPTDSYGDGALNQTGGVAGAMDVIVPVGSTPTTLYTANGSIVGQSIVRTRADANLESRVVFLAFGLEAVNRHYRKINNVSIPWNVRKRMTNEIRRFFKTGSVSGTVINDATNAPIPNFLVEVRGNGRLYFARTNADGTFNFLGVPQGSYDIGPAVDAQGPLNPGFLEGTGRSFSVNLNISATLNPGFPNVPTSDSEIRNFRPVPIVPGSLTGTAVFDATTPASNVDVLILSIQEGAPAGFDQFAQLTRTDADGRFAFNNVPSTVGKTQIAYKVIFNPDITDIPEASGLRPNYQNNGRGGPDVNIGRRVVPDGDEKYGRSGTIVIPTGDNFVLNDSPDDNAADSKINVKVPRGPDVTGSVTLTGVNSAGDAAIIPFEGALVQIFSGSNLIGSDTTDAAGNYVVENIQNNEGNTSYQIRYSGVVQGAIVPPVTNNLSVPRQSTPVVLGNQLLSIARISGKVTVNGDPTSGVQVTLLKSDGSVAQFGTTDPKFGRMDTTDESGNYLLPYIPTGNYQVQVTFGGKSTTVGVAVPDTTDVTGVNFALQQQLLSGAVSLQTAGNSEKTPLAGAVIELLDTNGNSLNPKITTTTNKQGGYSLTGIAPGSYRVRATFKGDVTTTDTIVVGPEATRAPALTIILHDLSVKVVDAKNIVIASAFVELRQNDLTVLSGSTNSQGIFIFKQIAAGSYTVFVTKGNLGGEAAIVIRRGTRPGLLTVKLQGDSTGLNNPTAFNVKSKIYLISIPYQDTNNPTTSNVSERTGTVSPATTKVKNAFTVPPVDPTTGQQNYLLQRFNPLTRAYENVDGEATLIRGVGYLLQVVNRGTSIKMPAQDTTRVALTDRRFEKTFTVTLRLNPSVRNDRNNGRNLIGFGFNPAKFGNVNYASSKVTHPDGRTVDSIAKAVANGWLKDQITTIDSRGSTPRTVSVEQLKSFGGYFVQTRVDGLKITFANPTK
jgi:Tol biopolymer transport system component